MARPFLLPDDDAELDRLLRRHTQSEVADMYGVSRQAVSKAVRDRNLKAPRRVSYKMWIPWNVAMDHQAAYLHRMLRYWAMAESGKTLTEAQASMFARFVQKMTEDDTVVHYDRTWPPQDRSNPHDKGGWMVLPRRHSVDKGWIRNPEVP